MLAKSFYRLASIDLVSKAAVAERFAQKNRRSLMIWPYLLPLIWGYVTLFGPLELYSGVSGTVEFAMISIFLAVMLLALWLFGLMIGSLLGIFIPVSRHSFTYLLEPLDGTDDRFVVVDSMFTKDSLSFLFSYEYRFSWRSSCGSKEVVLLDKYRSKMVIQEEEGSVAYCRYQHITPKSWLWGMIGLDVSDEQYTLISPKSDICHLLAGTC